MADPVDPPPPAERPELRIAVVMTGGVSLAIWMGGVATEIDQLVRARSTKEKRLTEEQRVYLEMLDLARYEPRVDVISGTSAGGVNGALLAAAVARGKSLTGLRSLWVDVASFAALLRSPYPKDPPSLMKGDDYFTKKLQAAFSSLLGDDEVESSAGDHPVDLLVTTTLLNGESSRLIDDFGTVIPDVSHNGIFRFDRDSLRGGLPLAHKLALAARSSASFPVAFEASWVPQESDTEKPDDLHPGMAGIASFRADHFVIDGGVLVNRPIEPALDAMFAMEADNEDVRRVLLYVVPDPGESADDQPETQTPAPALTGVALRSLVTIPRTQSVARDLERLKEHNGLVRAQQDARETLLRRWFPADVDAEMKALLPDYRARRASREVEALLAELTRRWPGSIVPSVNFKPVDRQMLTHQLEETLLATLPTEMPSATAPTAGQVAAWGIDSVVRAATVTLDLAQRGHTRTIDGSEARRALAAARKAAHEALQQLRGLRRARNANLVDKKPGQDVVEWAKAMLAMLREDDPAVFASAIKVAEALGSAAVAVRTIGNERLTAMANKLAPDAASPGECLRRLFALEVLQEAVGITTPVVEQRASLLQVSANTRDAFGAKRTAAEKLTGMHLAHFGAFYKPSWRANDWMWGRLDAAGWLAQLVLEPRRVAFAAEKESEANRAEAALRLIKGIALGPPGKVHDWLERELDEADLSKELKWLEPGSKLLCPTALPACSLAVARRIQLAILAEELPKLATAVRLDDSSDALSASGRKFLAVWDDGGDATPQDRLKNGLGACNFAAPGFAEERNSSLLMRDASTAAATAASAFSGTQSGLPDLITKSRIMTATRGVALAVHGLVDTALSRSRVAFATMIVAMAAAGALLAAAALTDGAQPALAGLGFTLLLAGWIVGLRGERFWLYLLLTIGVIAVCALIALIPWIAGELINDCPKVSDCTRGDIEAFIHGLEPGFIVLALVGGAAAFGSRTIAPRQ